MVLGQSMSVGRPFCIVFLSVEIESAIVNPKFRNVSEVLAAGSRGIVVKR